jgi:rare lipoprotein A
MAKYTERYWSYCLIAAGLAAATAAGAPADARIGKSPQSYAQVGIASWYGMRHHGRRTASGRIFNMRELTAAHRSLPFKTKARVTNLENGRTVDVTITDRGPAYKGRLIDLSAQAAASLGMLSDGLAMVRVEVVPQQTASSAID